MNFRVDVTIIGDSKAGHEILDKIASAKPAIKLAFISQAFKDTTFHDYNNVKYFRDEVEYVSYRHKLFCCYLKNGDNVFSTHLVVASGVNYEPYAINGKELFGVLNSLDYVTKSAKDQYAVVLGSQESDAKFAYDVAKKYKHVYFSSQDVNIVENISSAVSKKLTSAENITVLPNTSIKNVITNNGAVSKIVLDNYSEIDCSAVYAKTSSTPAIDFVPRKIISREDGYPAVKDNCESTLVPGCFAAGNCLKKYTKSMEQRLIESISKDF